MLWIIVFCLQVLIHRSVDWISQTKSHCVKCSTVWFADCGERERYTWQSKSFGATFSPSVAPLPVWPRKAQTPKLAPTHSLNLLSDDIQGLWQRAPAPCPLDASTSAFERAWLRSVFILLLYKPNMTTTTLKCAINLSPFNKGILYLWNMVFEVTQICVPGSRSLIFDYRLNCPIHFFFLKKSVCFCASSTFQ